MKLKNVVFWVVMPCDTLLEQTFQRNVGSHKSHIVTSQKMAFFVVTRQTVWLLVCKQTVPTATATGRGILVPTFVDGEVSRGQRSGTPTTINLSFLDRSHYFFFSNGSSFNLTRLSGPLSRPTVTQKICSTRNRTLDLCVCSQEL
jgi:hypothetical protein